MCEDVGWSGESECCEVSVDYCAEAEFAGYFEVDGKFELELEWGL